MIPISWAVDSSDYVRDLVFVGMPFKKEMDEVYATIRDVCALLSLRASRVDDSFAGSGFIIREITDLIEQAEFLVFDLTFERDRKSVV